MTCLVYTRSEVKKEIKENILFSNECEWRISFFLLPTRRTTTTLLLMCSNSSIARRASIISFVRSPFIRSTLIRLRTTHSNKSVLLNQFRTWR